MTEHGIQPSRVRKLNEKEEKSGSFVLYWMQQSQRAEFNHALEYAILQANRLNQPLLVAFGITDRYPEANLRHYAFLIEGLRQAESDLSKRGIRMVVRLGDPWQVALETGRDASLIVCDRGYLRHQKAWRSKLAQTAGCPVVQVESDVVVPVEAASGKAEYAARTIRPKIRKQLAEYLIPIPKQRLQNSSMSLEVSGLDLQDGSRLPESLRVDKSVSPVSQFFQGGTGEAKKKFDRFLTHRLERYSTNRNQPQTDDVSGVSPYLHFGQISPLYLALKAREHLSDSQQDVETLLEELIVRRELAVNFVEYTDAYDDFSCLPSWAARTLDEHRRDERPHVYSVEQLENGQTHDPYWNAAMAEMRCTGFMHNYMRMYWGKKILEWSPRPEEAYATALSINNRYFLDGRDPNSFTGVGWVFGVHDRPWGERAIFGKVRYMAASGLERKCDIRGYVRKAEQLSLAAGAPGS